MTSEAAEFLEMVERNLSQIIEEKDARRRWFEDTASKLLRVPVRVKFRSLEEYGKGTRGICVRETPHSWFIGIAPGLSPLTVASVWAHEVAHALCRHPKYLTQSQREHADALEAMIESGEASKLTGLDCNGILNDLQEKNEREADECGALLFHLFWPDAVYFGEG